MFSFFKKRITPEDVGGGVFDSIKRRYEKGRTDRFWPEKPLFREVFINDEWLFFDIFIFDLATFLAFGNTPERQKYLNPFERNVVDWLQHRTAPRFPEDRFCLINPLEGPIYFPPEDAEPMTKRLSRRVSAYSKATTIQHHMGENYVIGSVFSALCGAENDLGYIVGISTYFSHQKIASIEMLKTYRCQKYNEQSSNTYEL